MAKYLTILPHGLEGTGLEKNGIEFTEFINRTFKDRSAKLLSNNDARQMRDKNVHKNDAICLSFTKQFDEVKKLIDECDVLLSLGALFKKQTDEQKDNFIELLKYAKDNGKMTCYFQFIHKKRSLSNEMYTEPKYYSMFSLFDVVFNHSYENDFVKKYIEPNSIAVNRLVCRGDYGIENLFAIDFNEAKKKYWKKFEDKLSKSVKFIGRSSPWKGPWLLRDVHYKHLMKAGYTTTAEGIELSIGTLSYLYKQIKPKKIPRDDVNIEAVAATKANIAKIDNDELVLKKNSPMYVLPPYTNAKMMERMSKTQFGIELLNMSPEFMKDTIENAMFEIVCAGCVPIFRKAWAECFIVKGKPLAEAYSQEEIGTVFLDEEHPEEAIELMNKLSEDKDMYDKWRNAAFKFYSSLFDVKPVYNKLVEVIDIICKNSK